MNKNKRKKIKSQNSVGLFKIEAHLKYLQDVRKSYLRPMPLYIDRSISSKGALTQKVIDKMVTVYFIFDSKLFSEFLNVMILSM